MDTIGARRDCTYLYPGVATPISGRSSTNSLTVTDQCPERHLDHQERTGHLKCPADQMDSYTEGIELSNACRRFYVTRVQVAENIKATLNTDLQSSGSRTLDTSMGTLRREVVSLIDQDLTLMRQLLTLNERIEELKWHRKFSGYSPASMTTSASSGNILGSDGNMVSNWDVDTVSQNGDRLAVPNDGEGEKDPLHSKYLSPSNLSLFGECVYNSTQDNLCDVLPSDHNAMHHANMAESRTSDLGSSDELVNSVSDIRKADNPYRFSKTDSCISSECPSNSSSLKKSNTDNDTSEFRRMQLAMDRRITNVVQTIPTIDIRVHIENDDDDLVMKKYSHDSGIQEDHNLEMII